MPKLIYLTENMATIAKILNKRPEEISEKGFVIIECEYLPAATEGEVEIAEQVSATICRPRCGYFRDASSRGYIISCFTPTSPILLKLKQNLKRL